MKCTKRNIYLSVARGSKRENYTALGHKSYEAFAFKELGLKPRQAWAYKETVDRLGVSFCSSHYYLGIGKLAWLSEITLEKRLLVLKEEEKIKKMSLKEFKEYLKPYIEEAQQLSL